MSRFETAGDLSDWPPNRPGKPTQSAVFGVIHPDKSKSWEILWTGKFPDLEPAQYWAAKKEAEAVRKGKWIMASRLLWQHELTPEEAVAVARREMEPQVTRAMKSYDGGDAFEIGEGPMKTVDPSAHPRYVEISSKESDEVLGSFVVPPEVEGGVGFDQNGDDDGGMVWKDN